MQTEVLTYEARRAQEREHEQHRFQLALHAANMLAGYLTGGGSTTWRVEVTNPHGHGDRIEVTNGHGVIRVHPGGYGKSHRLVAYVPTQRHVQFGPDDYDTVRVTHDLPTEATVNEDKDPLKIAKEFARKLGSVALNVADALEEEQARMQALRAKGAAVVAEFRAAGWQVSDRPNSDAAYVYVPTDHALYRLGISALTVQTDTGRIDYQSRAYPAHDISVAELVGVKL